MIVTSQPNQSHASGRQFTPVGSLNRRLITTRGWVSRAIPAGRFAAFIKATKLDEVRIVFEVTLESEGLGDARSISERKARTVYEAKGMI